MNFLACNGTWVANVEGFSCDGQLVSVPRQELATMLNAGGATPEEWGALYDITMQIFVSVFVFLCIKRLLR